MMAETARTLQDGWLHTGDIGTIDAAGRLHIDGRKSNLIITSFGRKAHDYLVWV